jgi:hypothetical protein
MNLTPTAAFATSMSQLLLHGVIQEVEQGLKFPLLKTVPGTSRATEAVQSTSGSSSIDLALPAPKVPRPVSVSFH